MGWANNEPPTLTIPAGAGPNDARIVIGQDVPAELAAYYAGLNPAGTVIGVILSYDQHGNYFYQAWVPIQGGSPTWWVTGEVAFPSLTVTEYTRISVIPNAVPALMQQMFENGPTLFSVPSGTPTAQGMAVALSTDVNSPRMEILGNGRLRAGPGGTNINADTQFYRAAAGRWAMDDVSWNNSGAAETWSALALNNGWTNAGAGFVTAQVKRSVEYKRVHMVGCIAPGTKTDGTVVATLPVGLQPSTSVQVPVAQNSGTGATSFSPSFVLDNANNVKVFGANLTGLTSVSFNFSYPYDV